jgi:hypothetical protein
VCLSARRAEPFTVELVCTCEKAAVLVKKHARKKKPAMQEWVEFAFIVRTFLKGIGSKLAQQRIKGSRKTTLDALPGFQIRFLVQKTTQDHQADSKVYFIFRKCKPHKGFGATKSKHLVALQSFAGKNKFQKIRSFCVFLLKTGHFYGS